MTKCVLAWYRTFEWSEKSMLDMIAYRRHNNIMVLYNIFTRNDGIIIRDTRYPRVLCVFFYFNQQSRLNKK